MLARVYQELLRLPLRLHLSGVTALEMSSSGELRLHFSPARAQSRRQVIGPVHQQILQQDEIL